MPAQVKRGTSKKAALQRRALFVDAYLAKGENAVQAYIEVYGPGKSYGAQAVAAHQLLKDHQVQKAIEARRAQVRATFGLTTDRVMYELARVSYFNPKKLVDGTGRAVPLHQLDDDTAAALASVETIETTVEGKGDDQVVTTRRFKGRPFNKVSALDKSIKILRLYDKPLPPDTTGRPLDDARETARRMAFLLARGAAAADRQPSVRPAQKKKIRTPA